LRTWHRPRSENNIGKGKGRREKKPSNRSKIPERKRSHAENSSGKKVRKGVQRSGPLARRQPTKSSQGAARGGDDERQMETKRR